VPPANGSISNTPSGPFQSTVFALASSFLKSSMVFGPMSRPIQPSGTSATTCVFAAASNLSAATWSTGRTMRAEERIFFGEVELVRLDLRVADGLALRLEQRVGHAAADDDGVDLLGQLLEDEDLVRDLRAAHDGDEGLVGIAQDLAEVLDLLVDQEPGGRLLEVLGHARPSTSGRGGPCRRRRST
jgi:hypothetical protein